MDQKEALATFLLYTSPIYKTHIAFNQRIRRKEREGKQQFPQHFNLNRTRDGNNQRGIKKKKKKMLNSRVLLNPKQQHAPRVRARDPPLKR